MTFEWNEEHLAFIERCRVGRLATVDSSGEAYAVPICYAVLGSVLVTPIDEKPKRRDRPMKRVRNIEETGRATVIFDHYDDDDWSELCWLMLRGTARIVGPEDPWHAGAVAALRQRYQQYREMRLEDAPLIVIEPDRIASWGI